MSYPLSHRRLVVLLAVFTFAIVSPSQSKAGQQAAPPATQPAVVVEKPEAEPVGAEVDVAIRKAFAELADADPVVREAAKRTLMGIERRYLPALQRLATEAKPLLPEQLVALRQIVTHVYAAGEPYETEPGSGFLGVRMHTTTVSLKEIPGGEFGEFLPQYGVIITERLVGFVGNRMLIDGDIVLAIAERPDIQFRIDTSFSNSVREMGPGRVLNFYVLRRGKILKVPIALDPRPTEGALGQQQQPAGEDVNTLRRRKAEEYWRETFAKALKESVG